MIFWVSGKPSKYTKYAGWCHFLGWEWGSKHLIWRIFGKTKGDIQAPEPRGTTPGLSWVLFLLPLEGPGNQRTWWCSTILFETSYPENLGKKDSQFDKHSLKMGWNTNRQTNKEGKKHKTNEQTKKERQKETTKQLVQNDVEWWIKTPTPNLLVVIWNPEWRTSIFLGCISGVGPTLDARSLFLGGGHTQGYLGCAQVWENAQLMTIFLLNDKQMSNKVRVEHQPEICTYIQI